MNPHLSSTRDILLALEWAVRESIIGQDDLIRKLIITLFASGHALIEWVPWLGKTEVVKTLARVLGYDFKRVSFTPDLLPGDITGYEMYRKESGKFEVRKGPVFTHILLADEINRTPPKVQSALLEAMEERQITIGEKSLALPSPFFVIATENPLEHEGTYPLPEAELDRFLMKLIVTYPAKSDEKKIIIEKSRPKGDRDQKSWSLPKISTEELAEIQNYIIDQIRIDDKIYDYISDILVATRSHAHGISYGASTRAGLALVRTARILALLEGRDYVLPEDVKSLAPDILRHRIGLSYEALSKKISPDMIVREILESVRVP